MGMFTADSVFWIDGHLIFEDNAGEKMLHLKTYVYSQVSERQLSK